VTPDEAAGALLAKAEAEFGWALPIDVDEIATELEGLDIAERANLARLPGLEPPPTGPLSGLLLPEEKRIWLEAAEAARSLGRRRFTIAHELGHWCLHHQETAHARRAQWCRPTDVGPDVIKVKGDRRFEGEANRFAASLLMPEAHVRAEAEEARLNIPLLARRFGVSARAMQIRLETLQMLPDYMK
jgi:hypothetical protein